MACCTLALRLLRHARRLCNSRASSDVFETQEGNQSTPPRGVGDRGRVVIESIMSVDVSGKVLEGALHGMVRMMSGGK